MPKRELAILQDSFPKLFVAPLIFVIFILLISPVFFILIQIIINTKYIEYILQNNILWASYLNSLIFTLFTSAMQVFLGILSGIMVFSCRIKGFFLLIVIVFLFLPYALPSSIVVQAWKFLLLEKGSLSILFSSWTKNGSLLNDYSFISVIIVSIWQFYPFVFIVMLTRLRKIPNRIFKTAMNDGADYKNLMKYVVFPQIKGTLVIVFILRFIFMFTKFDTPYMLKGKDIGRLNLLALYIYDNITSYNTLGVPIFLMFITSILIIVVGIFYLKKKKEHLVL